MKQNKYDKRTQKKIDKMDDMLVSMGAYAAQTAFTFFAMPFLYSTTVLTMAILTTHLVTSIIIGENRKKIWQLIKPFFSKSYVKSLNSKPENNSIEEYDKKYNDINLKPEVEVNTSKHIENKNNKQKTR